MRSNIRWIWRFRPPTNVTWYQGLSVSRKSFTISGRTLRPSMDIPLRSRSIPALVGLLLSLTSYTLGIPFLAVRMRFAKSPSFVNSNRPSVL